MKFIILILGLSLNSAYAKNFHCKIENHTQSDIDIQVDGRLAEVTITHGHTYRYQDCSTIKDDVGLLIDCKGGILDLMVLMNPNARSIKGGVMSKTHNIFEDINC